MHPSTAVPLAAQQGCAFPMARAVLAAGALLLAFVGAARGQGLSQDFDSVTAPDLPAGWSQDTGWATSTSSASIGSGFNNLVHTGMGAGTVASESFSLVSAASATLTYLARRTSSYPAENLVVTASIDGGVSWPIPVVMQGSALPAASSEWGEMSARIPETLLGEPDVRIRFEGAGGVTSGANVRIDDVVVAFAAGDGGGTDGGGGETGSAFGFSSATSSVVESTTGFEIPLVLEAASPDGIQAVQFVVTWDHPLLTFAEVLRGTAVSDFGAWNVSASVGAQSVSILVLGQAGASIGPGTHDPVLRLQFDVGSLEGAASAGVTVTVRDVVGALAVPTGEDAGLAAVQASHELAVTRRAGVFSAASSVDVGSAVSGSTVSAVLTVGNPGGLADLTVLAVASSHAAFSVSPLPATIAPDGSQDFTVSFAPTATDVGAQAASLTFTHDGSNGPTTVVGVTGTGASGRGDADADGIVDVVDVLAGVDVALGRVAPTTAVLASLDLFPWLSGDGSIDVRDLTVLVQAIMSGQWPDGVALPAAGAGKGRMANRGGTGSPARLRVDRSSGEVILLTSETLRAVQFDLVGMNSAAARAAEIAGKAPARVGVAPGGVRVMWVPFDGSILDPGEWPLVELGSGAPFGLELGHAVAVSDAGERLAVVLDRPHEAGPAREAPYPNPFRPSAGERVTLPFVPAGTPFTVVNALGRTVRRAASGMFWDGRDDASQLVSPGIYYVRAASSRYPVLVMR